MNTLNVTSEFINYNAFKDIKISPNSYGNYKLKDLSGDFKAKYVEIVSKLIDKEPSPEYNVLSFKSSPLGYAEKTYPASIVKSANNKVAIHFGTEIVELAGEIPTDIKLTIETFKFSQYDDIALLAYDKSKDTEIAFPLRINEASYASMLQTLPNGTKKMNYRKIAASVSDGDFGDLLDCLAEGKTGSATALTDIRELPIETLMKVIALKRVNVLHNGNPSVSYIPTVEHEGNQYSFWLPNDLKVAAELGAIKPYETAIGYYLTEPNKKGKSYVKGFKASLTGSVTVEAVAEIVEEPSKSLPFATLKEAHSWAKEAMPSLSDSEIKEILKGCQEDGSGSKMQAFYDVVTKLAQESIIPF